VSEQDVTKNSSNNLLARPRPGTEVLIKKNIFSPKQVGEKLLVIIGKNKS
jgi:hypothetical protein